MAQGANSQQVTDKEPYCRCADLLGANLRQMRKDRALPLKRLAYDLGVSPAIVSAWENGKRFPSSNHIDQLADYFGKAPCQLICAEQEICHIVGKSSDSCNPKVHK